MAKNSAYDPPPVRILHRAKTVARQGLPSWAKVLIRGGMATGLIMSLFLLGFLEPVANVSGFSSLSFSLFALLCLFISLLFGMGYLFITKGMRGTSKKEGDIPSMAIILMKAGISIGLLHLAYIVGLLPGHAREFVVSVFSYAWVIFAVSNYVYHTFRRIT